VKHIRGNTFNASGRPGRSCHSRRQSGQAAALQINPGAPPMPTKRHQGHTNGCEKSIPGTMPAKLAIKLHPEVRCLTGSTGQPPGGIAHLDRSLISGLRNGPAGSSIPIRWESSDIAVRALPSAILTWCWHILRLAGFGWPEYQTSCQQRQFRTPLCYGRTLRRTFHDRHNSFF